MIRLFDIKLFSLLIILVGMSFSIKSETPAHCSELYGCQSEDPQEKIISSNYKNEEEKYFYAAIKRCKKLYKNDLLSFLPKSGYWFQRYNRYSFSGKKYEIAGVVVEDLDLKLLSIKSPLDIINQGICPIEFSEYVITRKEPTFDRNKYGRIDELNSKKSLAEKERLRKQSEQKKQKALAEKKRKRKLAEDERNKQVLKELEAQKVTLGMGSGFWFNSEGYFATNQHVIEGCKSTQVKVNNKLIDSEIISFDKINDLAIGKIDKKVESVFSLSDKPELGEEVMVGGFPLSDVLQNDSIKITRGIVSSLSGVNNNYTMLQIDAPIQKGNSGGPIINSYGEVIGVATSYLKSTKEYEAQNVNFGVKVNLLRNMSESVGINVEKKTKKIIKNSKQLAKALEKNTLHIHCTNTLREWVAYQNKQGTNAKLSEHIKLNLKDYMK